jgi:hypothetical protein
MEKTTGTVSAVILNAVAVILSAAKDLRGRGQTGRFFAALGMTGATGATGGLSARAVPARAGKLPVAPNGSADDTGPIDAKARLDQPTVAPVCDDPAGLGLEAAGDGRMWLDPRYQTPLDLARLADFQSLMECRAGRCLRALRDRENWRLEIQEGSVPRGVFLKKHHFRSFWSWLRVKLGIGPPISPGMLEAVNVGRMTAAGIRVMDVVAYGEAFHGDGRVESFLLTEELSGYDELHVFLRKRFAPRALDRNTRRDPRLARIIGDVAEIVRRFHGAGYNHRDLYCCHLFARESAAGRFEIKMIDLQRVQHRCLLRRRWIVKDLAQLAWSTPRDRIKCTQKLAFIRRYLGVAKLRPCDKRLIREVLAKQQTMERRLGIEP